MTTSSPTTVGRERGGVEHGAVLHRRAGADRDDAVVAPEHRLGPDRRPRAQGDVADDGGVGVDVGRRDRSAARRHRARRWPSTDPTGEAARPPIRRGMAEATTTITVTPKQLGKHLRSDPPQEGALAVGGGPRRRAEPTRARRVRARQGPDPRERPLGARRIVRRRRRRADAEHDVARARPPRPTATSVGDTVSPAAPQPGRRRRSRRTSTRSTSSRRSRRASASR